MMFDFFTRRRAASAVVCAVLSLVVTDARAAYTTIKAPDPIDNEDSHEHILEHIYGGNFTKSGVNYSNGTINVLRVEDSTSNNAVLGLVDGQPGGTASDRYWHDGFTDATAKVRFARDQQTFGYFNGTTGDTFTKLFDVSGTGYAVTGTTSMSDMRGKTWRWGRDRGRGGIHSSLPTENPDDLDHLVTYKVQGLADTRGYTVWLLFWEDLNFNPAPDTLTTDRDLNDLVVEIRAIAAVPEPATGALAVLGLGAALTRRARRRI